MKRLRYAPKVALAATRRIYIDDTSRPSDDELVVDVGLRLVARCRDVLMVSASEARCPDCRTVFEVPWIGRLPDLESRCSHCAYSVTTAEYHAGLRHQDLWGLNGSVAFASFVAQFPLATSTQERMPLIDRLVHAVHATGGRTARNLLEGRPPRKVIEALDALSM